MSCESEGIDCIFMLFMCVMHIRICWAYPHICLCGFKCVWNTWESDLCVSFLFFRILQIRNAIKFLCTLLCGGSYPGSGTVMDSVVCQSLGCLLASGTEVALLNTALPHLSPNTPSHFKVNCVRGAVGSPPQVTRLLHFCRERLLLSAQGSVLECGGGWLVQCLVPTHSNRVIHMRSISTHAQRLARELW